MDKIKAEMDSSQNPWIKKIGNYLLSRNDLEDKLNNQNKSLKECFDYILIEISKQSVKEGVTGYAAGEDDEIYSLAVHYFDEDNLEIGKKNFTTNADGSVELSRLMPKKQDVKEHAKDIDAIVNQKVKAELEKIREEEKVKKQKREELKKAAKKHKEDMERAQMSLFDQVDYMANKLSESDKLLNRLSKLKLKQYKATDFKEYMISDDDPS